MIFEAAHQMALLPLIALIVVLVTRGIPDRDQWFLSASFFMSWIGDSLTSFFGEGRYEYLNLWAPAQIAFALMAGYRGALNLPIFIYFVPGTVALVFFLDGRTMGFWLLYQTCRLAGILVLCFIILKPPPKEFDRVVYN